jgi:hypothetical protein
MWDWGDWRVGKKTLGGGAWGNIDHDVEINLERQKRGYRALTSPSPFLSPKEKKEKKNSAGSGILSRDKSYRSQLFLPYSEDGHHLTRRGDGAVVPRGAPSASQTRPHFYSNPWYGTEYCHHFPTREPERDEKPRALLHVDAGRAPHSSGCHGVCRATTPPSTTL